MTSDLRDTLSRTTKLEIDEGRAHSIAEAERMVQAFVLQIACSGVAGHPAREAAFLTVVNTGARAFPGGVRVVTTDGDSILRHAWGAGRALHKVVEEFGGTIAEALDARFPTIVIGPCEPALGSIRLRPTWDGWSGGVIEGRTEPMAEGTRSTLAAMIAGAFAVSEAFQHIRGEVTAGRRSAGLSLWKPDLDWRTVEARGPSEPQYLPESLWLLGLGHLGQAVAWAIGLLPYPSDAPRMLFLQDYDSVVKANRSTGLLCDEDAVGHKKTRVVARRLEGLGFSTSIIERPFDETMRRRLDEPAIAIAGFDAVEPRRALEAPKFKFVVDLGLGGGAQSYLDIVMHAFPSALVAEECWPERANRTLGDVGQPGWQNLRSVMEGDGMSSGDAECGMVEVAGRSVGASFVGCIAAAIGLSEVLRLLAGGPQFEIISVSLKSPEFVEILANRSPAPSLNPGFIQAA